MESKGVTRRDIAAGLLSTVALSGQTAAPEPPELVEAKQNARRNSEQLRKLSIPMSTEPSFTFKSQW